MVCADANDAEKFADELARRYPVALHVIALPVPIIRAAVALKRNQPVQAIDFLRSALPYEGGPAGVQSAYLRGQRSCGLHHGAEAAVEFRRSWTIVAGTRSRTSFLWRTWAWRVR